MGDKKVQSAGVDFKQRGINNAQIAPLIASLRGIWGGKRVGGFRESASDRLLQSTELKMRLQMKPPLRIF